MSRLIARARWRRHRYACSRWDKRLATADELCALLDALGYR